MGGKECPFIWTGKAILNGASLYEHYGITRANSKLPSRTSSQALPAVLHSGNSDSCEMRLLVPSAGTKQKAVML